MFIAALFKITKYSFSSYPNAKKKSRKEIMYSNDNDGLTTPAQNSVAESHKHNVE